MLSEIASGAWLVGFLTIQRFAELAFAHRNTKTLRAAGGVEFGASHYPFIVALHAFWLLGFWLLAHNRNVDLMGFGLFAVLQGFRLWVLLSLGRRWTTRVIVLPGAPDVTAGPYRWFKHPNYGVVAMEIALLPLALRLPLFAFIFFIANSILLALRIRIENEALAWAARGGCPSEADGSVTLAKG